MRRLARATTAGAGALAALAGSILWALPAQACSCGRPDLDAALDDGQSVAIVSRTDDGRADGTSAARATFRIEDSLGPELPETIASSKATGGGCQPFLAPGAVGALVFERKAGDWAIASCLVALLGPALQRVQGNPSAVEGGPATAYAAGPFGNSRLAALDRVGRVVAWDQVAGYGQQVATCPGGKVVVALGRAGSPDDPSGAPELTVHDATTLRVLRTVRLTSTPDHSPLAMRCADDHADRVEILARGGGPGVDLLVVRGTNIETVDVGQAVYAETVPSGFVVLAGGEVGTSLALIRPDGRRSGIADLPDLGSVIPFAVSPDGRTVALSGDRAGPEGDAIVTVDTTTGERLAQFAPGPHYVTGLAWTASGTLLVREVQAPRLRDSIVRAVDRMLTELDRWPATTDLGLFTAVGDAAVAYGDGFRPTVMRHAGSPLVAASLRLAASAHLVALPGAAFAPGGESPAPDRTALVVPSRSSTTVRLVAALGGFAAVAVAAAIALTPRRRA